MDANKLDKETQEALKKLGVSELKEGTPLYQRTFRPGTKEYDQMEENVKFILPLLYKQDTFVGFFTLYNALSIFLQEHEELGRKFEINGGVLKLPEINSFNVLIDTEKVKQ